MDRKIDHLTEMMKGLALSVRILQNNIGFLITKNVRSRLSPISSTNLLQPNNLGASSQSDLPEGVNRYLYCWTLDHYLKWHCPAFQDDLNSNWIYLGDNQKLCLGPYILRAWHIFMK